MGGTTLHAGIVAQWFEILLLLHFFKSATMVVNGILFGVLQRTVFNRWATAPAAHSAWYVGQVRSGAWYVGQVGSGRVRSGARGHQWDFIWCTATLRAVSSL